MPTQFKRHNFQPRFETIYPPGTQPPPNMPPGAPGQLNSMNPMGYPPMGQPPMGQQMSPPRNPPMNQMGHMSGGFQFNQPNYMQQPPRGNTGYAPPPNQQLQNSSNPFNLLQKRDQPPGVNYLSFMFAHVEIEKSR